MRYAVGFAIILFLWCVLCIGVAWNDARQAGPRTQVPLQTMGRTP